MDIKGEGGENSESGEGRKIKLTFEDGIHVFTINHGIHEIIREKKTLVL